MLVKAAIVLVESAIVLHKLGIDSIETTVVLLEFGAHRVSKIEKGFQYLTARRFLCHRGSEGYGDCREVTSK